MELLFSLIAGLIIAFALQLLLANLGIALGLTVLDLSPKQKQSSSKSANVSLPITHLLGFGVTLSLSTVLFAAGLLTTEFSEIAAPRRGIIFGIILWASYWLLFIWLSSTTLSSLADSVLATALGSGRRLITAIGRGINRTEQTALEQLTEEVSELIKEQQQFSQQLAEQREALIAEMEILAAEQQEPSVEPLAKEPVSVEIESTPSSSLSPSSVMSRLNIPSGRQLLDRAMDQVSDVDIQTLWQQFRQNGTISPEAAIPQDMADYLRQVPAWMFQPEVLKETFSERIYDPEASPEQIRAQLATVDRDHIIGWLQERGDLAAEQVETLADRLSSVKDAVVAAIPSVPEVVEPDVIEDIQARLIAYCRYTNLDLLTPDRLIEKVQSQLEEHEIANASAIAKQLDLEEIKAVLGRRQGLSATDQKQLIKALRSALPHTASRAPRRWAVRSGRSAQQFGQQLAKQVGYYLQYQDKAALNPGQMTKDLSHLAKASLSPLLEHLPDPKNLGKNLSEYVPDSLFDRHVWQQALEQRRDMTAAEVQHILSGTESVWQQTRHQLNGWADIAWSDVQETIKSKNAALLNAASHQVSEGLSSAQEALSSRIDTVKTDLQTQADAARGQVAIASWWLFSSLLLSGLSAAASGWLAVRY